MIKSIYIYICILWNNPKIQFSQMISSHFLILVVYNPAKHLRSASTKSNTPMSGPWFTFLTHSNNAGQITKAHMLHSHFDKVLIPHIPAFACEQMTCSNRRVWVFSLPLLGDFTLKWHAWSYMSHAKYGCLFFPWNEPFFYSKDMQVIMRVDTESCTMMLRMDSYLQYQ